MRAVEGVCREERAKADQERVRAVEVAHREEGQGRTGNGKGSGTSREEGSKGY